MRIEGIIASYSPETLRSPAGGARSSKERTGSSNTPKDSVEFSPEARKRLERVLGRIDKGFYNSDSVREEISDKLSGVLDELTH